MAIKGVVIENAEQSAEADARLAALAAPMTLPSFLAEWAEVPVDDRVLTYIEQARPIFDLPRRAEAQFAGLLALVAAGNRPVRRDNPMLMSARIAFRDGAQALKCLTRPSLCRHHHRHLKNAAAVIEITPSCADKGLRSAADPKSDLDSAHEPLKRDNQQMIWATSALPGVAMVALDKGCCANRSLGRRAKVAAAVNFSELPGSM